MEKEIKSLLIVKSFTDYFIKKARRALKIRKSKGDSINFDVFMRTKHIWIWFHDLNGLVGKVEFEFSGRLISKNNYRKEET